MQVLVIRPSSLGDVVHALPIVADIRRFDASASIDWVAEEAFASLVALHPQVRRVVTVALRRWRHHLFDRPTWHEAMVFRRALREERYDAVLDLQEQVKGAAIARLARGTRHGFDRHSVREPASTLLHDRHHAVDRERHFEERCRALAASALGYRFAGPPRYGIVAPAPPAGALPRGPFAVCVHATSRDDKRWPDTHWRRFIEHLSAAGLEAVLPWGTPGERERSESLAQGHPNARVPERRPLPEVAAVLRAAAVVVGVDTGLVHLAAGLGTPTVALFTRTDPQRAGVSIAGAHAIDLGGGGTVPSLDDVTSAVGRLLRRAPRC